jgi:WD40 associated region in TFIID subunit, NTD2 domain
MNTDWNAEDLQKVVLEYLTKKGFHKTETLLRLEASQVQEAMQIGQSYKKLADPFYGSSEEAYELLEGFIQQSLDIYKGEMARILWPVFAHMFLDLIAESREDEDKAEEGSHLTGRKYLIPQPKHFSKNIQRNMSYDTATHSSN